MVNGLGSGVSELDVAFASAMVQEANQTDPAQPGDMPPASMQALSPDMGAVPPAMPPQPEGSIPPDMPATDPGMAMPGMSGMPEQPGMMPGQPAPASASPSMSDPASAAPPPMAAGMASPSGNGLSAAHPVPSQAATPSSAAVAGSPPTPPSAIAEEESADILATRLLAIMAMPDSHAQPSERALATDGLILKLPALSPEARQLVAQRFCLMERPSEALTSAVLAHVSGALRLEVLENARFSTWRLLQLVQQLAPDERQRIARRRHLPTVVSEALIETGDPACLLELVRNAHARIDEHAFHALVDLAARQPDLQAPLATRSDLPPAVGFRLFRHVPPRLRRHLVSRFLSDSQLLDRVFSLILQDPPPASAEQVSRIESMIDSVAAGELETAAGLLARLLDLHDEAAHWIVADRWGEPLVVVLKVLGYARTTFPQAMGRIFHSPASPVENGRELAELQALFDSLSFNKARLLLLYWDWEARRMGPYTLLAEDETSPDTAGEAADSEAKDDAADTPRTALAGEMADAGVNPVEAPDDARFTAATEAQADATDANSAQTGANETAGAMQDAETATSMSADTPGDNPAAVMTGAHETAGTAATADGVSLPEENPPVGETAMPAPDGAGVTVVPQAAEAPAQDVPVAPQMAEPAPHVPGTEPGLPGMSSQASGIAPPCAPGQAPCPPAGAPCMPAPCVPGVARISAEDATQAATGNGNPSPLQGQMPPQPEPPTMMSHGQTAQPQPGAIPGHATPPTGFSPSPAAMPGGETPPMTEAQQPPDFGHAQAEASAPPAGGMTQVAAPMAQAGMTMPGAPMSAGAVPPMPQPSQMSQTPPMPPAPGGAPSPMVPQAPAGTVGSVPGAPTVPMMDTAGQPAGMAPTAPGMAPMPPMPSPPPDGAVPGHRPVTFGKRKMP